MKNLTILLLAFLSIKAFAQDIKELQPTADKVIYHSHYSLSYSEEHEQAEWVMYELTADEARGGYERSDNFRADPDISTGSAQLNDYKGSGYDRGHLAPAGDMAFSTTAMSESFYLSNMSPQHPSFNRGGWKSLEALSRAWALEDGDLYIITGPVLKHTRGQIGSSRVSIPAYYYKILFDIDEGERRSIAFLMPNASISSKVEDYVVSVDSLEVLTGIDFFPGLADSLEDQLESRTTGAWDFEISLKSPANAKSSQNSSQQCAGRTADGNRCRRQTKSSDLFCWQHSNQSTSQNSEIHNSSVARPCKGTTQQNRPCKRSTKNTSGYCWQHE